MILERNAYRVHRPSARSAWARPLVHLSQTRPYCERLKMLLQPDAAIMALDIPPMIMAQVAIVGALAVERASVEVAEAPRPEGLGYTMVQMYRVRELTVAPDPRDLRQSHEETVHFFAWRELLLDEARLVHVSEEAAAGRDAQPGPGLRPPPSGSIIVSVDGSRRATFADGSPVSAVRVRTLSDGRIETWALGPMDRWPTPARGGVAAFDTAAADGPQDQALAHFDEHIAPAYVGSGDAAIAKRAARDETAHLAGQMAPYLHGAAAMRERHRFPIDVTMDQTNGDDPVSMQIGSDTVETDRLVRMIKAKEVRISEGWKGVWLIG